MDMLDHDIAAAVDQDVAEPAVQTPEQELQSHADYHHRTMVAFLERVTEARKAGHAAIAEWSDERRRLQQAFEEDMRRIDGEVATIMQVTAKQVAHFEKLAGASRKALEDLQS